jgi:hypothetical protein
LPELCEVAGLKGVTVISDLLEFAEPIAADKCLAMLRGAGS